MFDFATRDLSLAIAHHLLIFLLAGVLAFEIGVIRPNMKREDVLRVASVDNWYGILAVAILVVGFSRAIYAAKGWAYYEANGFFWAKIAAFVAVAAVDHSDDTDHSLAPGADSGCSLPPDRAGHR
jgi:putative membrane protein